MKPPEIIETERLRLRIPTVHDAEAVFAGYAQDPEVTRFLTWSPHKHIGTTRAFLQSCVEAWERGGDYGWVITRREHDEAIGMVGLRVGGFKADVGYVLARPFWGRGYMPEAVQPVVDWAFAQPPIYRVWAICDVENHASARVLEKVGMVREGVLRRWVMHANLGSEPRDCLCYAKVK
ncbi:MAG: GNAT family N-acetyltransferase [Anaerolineae bacterium]|nr:GNAT family N-acetyltransferase [Anaerolineae bacterium]